MNKWQLRQPTEAGAYLCFMDNGYIKMCFYEDGVWTDMWKSELDKVSGDVAKWMPLPSDDVISLADEAENFALGVLRNRYANEFSLLITGFKEGYHRALIVPKESNDD